MAFLVRALRWTQPLKKVVMVKASGIHGWESVDRHLWYIAHRKAWPADDNTILGKPFHFLVTVHLHDDTLANETNS